MAYDIYDASIPPLIHMLGSLSHVLAKGEAHGGIDPNEARLAPDMLPLKAQVYIATDGAKGCGARLAGVDIPKFEDVETTFRRPAGAGGQDHRLPQDAWTARASPAPRTRTLC